MPGEGEALGQGLKVLLLPECLSHTLPTITLGPAEGPLMQALLGEQMPVRVGPWHPQTDPERGTGNEVPRRLLGPGVPTAEWLPSPHSAARPLCGPCRP